MISMIFVAIGFALHLAAVVKRAIDYPTRVISSGDLKRCRLLICLSLVGVLTAFFGFAGLSSAPARACVDYSSVLVILSLLSAAVIPGFFTFSYGRAAEEEACLPNAISICFMGLFYLLFGSLSFYMGKSKAVHDAEGMAIVGPLIMSLILVVNVLFDFWDYYRLETPDEEQSVSGSLDKGTRG